jgi:benzoate membrane transport protein
MSRQPSLVRRAVPALGAALPVVIIYLAVLSIVLTAGQRLHLSTGQLTSWIVALYGVAPALSIILTWRYRQPLILTGNVFAIIFFASLAGKASYAELVGASVAAGALVAVLGGLGLISRLGRLIPAPIVLGLLAGAVLPYVVGIFDSLDAEPWVVGTAVLAYILGRRFLSTRVPPVLPAFIVGLGVAAVTGRLGDLPTHWSIPVPTVTMPAFSAEALISLTPVLVVLMTLQANVPSMIFMRHEGYRPPERVVDVVSGIGTLGGSFLGPTAVSMPVLLIPLVAGPDAGAPEVRHWSVYLCQGASLVLALLAGVAAVLAVIFPLELLRALAGLSLLGVLVSSLQQMVRGPLVLGPVFTFAIALSTLSLFGLNQFFWAIALGMGISLLLERDGLRALREQNRSDVHVPLRARRDSNPQPSDP